MKKFSLPLYLVFIFLFSYPCAAEETSVQAQTGSLTVIITGFRTDGGQARIALVNSEDNYKIRKAGKYAVRTAGPEVKDHRAECVFTDLPYGEYAIKLYHDENGNGKLDSNFLKIPAEQYGFSNSARGTFGLPGYKEVKFIFDSSHPTHEIRLD